MRKTIHRLTLLIAAISCLITLPAGASYFDFSEGIQRGGNPSPRAGFSDGESNSRINDYINQDEQINLDTESGTMRVLRTDQKALVNEFVPVLIPVRNANPRELRPIIRAICRMEGGNAQVIRDKVKKEYFLQVTCPSFQLPYLRDAVAALDREWVTSAQDGTEIVIFQPKFRDVRRTDFLAGDYAGGAPASTTFDPLNNSATHYNDSAQIANYMAVTTAADIPVSEILVEAKFYEIVDQDDMRLGLDYLAWKNGPGRNLFEFIFAAEKSVQWFKGASSIFAPFTPGEAADASGQTVKSEISGTQRYAAYSAWFTAAYLDFLQSRGKAKVLVSPNLQTRSGTPAFWASSSPVTSIVSSGDLEKKPYSRARKRVERGEGDDTGNAGDLGAWDRFLNYDHSGQVGVFLDILPAVGLESTEMAVRVSVSSVTGSTPQGLPMVAQRSIETLVRTRDGETIALAGLKRRQQAKQYAGMPFLSAIPGVKYLVGQDVKSKRTSDLVVTLTTHVSVQSPSKIAMPLSLDKAREKVGVEGLKDVEVPSNPFGFDQWLLGGLSE